MVKKHALLFSTLLISNTVVIQKPRLGAVFVLLGIVYTYYMLSVLTVPTYVIAVLAFMFGVIIGSFLNVVIYRLHTNKSIQGRSHCLTCGVTLEWFELLPMVSYVVLRGRCRSCEGRITPRYFLVELLTGLLFIGVVLTAPAIIPALIMLLVVSVLVVVVVYDYYHYIIPDILVWWLLALAAVQLGYQWWGVSDGWSLLWTVSAAVAGASFFALLWVVSSGRWLGLGDAKLALPLGLLLTPAQVFSFIVFSFWLGAIISLLLMGWQYVRRRGQPHLRFLPQPLTIKSEVPFAPFLVLGFLVVYFFALDALQVVSVLL